MPKHINSCARKARILYSSLNSADKVREAQWVRAFLGIVVAGLVFSGCSATVAPEVAPTVTVQVDAAEKETIQRKVIADAVLYPRDQAAIVPKISSPVKKFYVNRGNHVKAGQLLAELENQDLAGAQAKSQGGYQQAEATYRIWDVSANNTRKNWTRLRIVLSYMARWM